MPSSSGQGEATSSQASARTPLSKAQLLAAGESVCRHLNKELAASKDVIRTQADYARVAPQRAAIVSASMVELKKLTPPASIAGDWQKIVSDRQSLDEYITKLGQDATAKDSNAIRLALASSSVVVQDLYAVATRVGLKECAHIG